MLRKFAEAGLDPNNLNEGDHFVVCQKMRLLWILERLVITPALSPRQPPDFN